MKLHNWTHAFLCNCFLASLQILNACASEPVSFRSEVAPIFLKNCVACHSAKKAEGGYRLDTFAELLKAGDSGIAPIVQSVGATHELLRRLTVADETERMPAESEALTAEQVDKITQWIAEGAKFDGGDPNVVLPFVIPPPRHPDPPNSYPTTIPITAIVFSPDGTQVLTSGYYEILVWNLADGNLVRRIKNVGERVFAITFSFDATMVAVACGTPGRSGEVRLIDFASGEVKAVIARSTDVNLDIAFRPGTRELAVASADSSIRIVNVDTLEVGRMLTSHADWVTAIAWSDDGSRLVSASRDKSAKVFDASTGELLVSYQGHNAAVRGITVLPDGTQILSSGSDGKLHRWQSTDAKKMAEVNLGGEGFHLKRGDGWILVPCAGGQLLKIDVVKDSVVQDLKGHQDWVLSTDYSAMQSRIASGAFNGELRIWNSVDGTLVNSWLAKP